MLLVRFQSKLNFSVLSLFGWFELAVIYFFSNLGWPFKVSQMPFNLSLIEGLDMPVYKVRHVLEHGNCLVPACQHDTRVIVGMESWLTRCQLRSS